MTISNRNEFRGAAATAAARTSETLQTEVPQKIERMKVRDLIEHPVVQRTIVRTTLQRIIDHMDLNALGVLHAVYYGRNGQDAKIMIVDGQHRLKALNQKGFHDLNVLVEVHYEVNDDAGAAALFLRLQNRSSIDTYSKFKIQCESGEPAAIGTVAVTKFNNLEVGSQCGDGKVACVASLMKLWNVDQGNVLSETLGTLIAAWGPSASSLEGKLVEGLGNVFARYNDMVDKPALVRKLAKYPGGSAALVGDARGMRKFGSSSVAACIADLIINLHDSGKRTGRLMPDKNSKSAAVGA